MELYKVGYKLKNEEYLLKIREKDNTGFMAKFNQKGEIPLSFAKWSINKYPHGDEDPLPIYIFKEEFRSGWSIESWRFGKSQNWATMMHPEGFTVEIYLSQLLELMEDITVIKKELIGEFKWERKKLIYRSYETWK